jgi:hypothetical protein
VLTYLKLSTPDKYVERTSIAELLDSKISTQQHDLCEGALRRWADALLSGQSNPADQHIVFLNGNNVRYERSDVAGFAVYRNDADLAVVAVLGPILLLGFVTQGPGWLGTRIDPNGSMFHTKPQGVPAAFGIWLRQFYTGLQGVAH